MKKEDFGKVPAYLTHVKEEIKRENELIENYLRKKNNQYDYQQDENIYEEIDEDERLNLLDALKSKWDSVNKEYQKITHLVKLDTTGQIRRKEALENQLTSLENDIEKLEKASTVLIRN